MSMNEYKIFRTAEDAKELTKKAIENNLYLQYREVLDLIEKDARRGHYHTYLGYELPTAVKEQLEIDGFIITYDIVHSNNYPTRISWEENKT